MSLRREMFNLGARVLIPFIPVFVIFLGIALAVTPRASIRLVPAYNYADSVFPTPLWGMGFIIVGLMLTYGFIWRKKELFQFSLAILIIWMLFLAVVFFLATVYDDAFWGAPGWPVFVAVTSWAVMLYLEDLDL